MKYNLGDVVELVDGIDYNGDSLSYQEGIKCEIMAVKNNMYTVYGFYREVSEDEIENRVLTHKQKLRKFSEYLDNIGKSVYKLKYNEDNVLVYKPTTIDGFSFEYEEYMEKDGKHNVVCLGIDPCFSELDAWKNETFELRDKLKKIREIF